MNQFSSLDGCIFGWVLFPEIQTPIAHHTGIILEWDEENPWGSIVLHYGSDCTSRVLLETLEDAVIRSEVKVVHINPYYRVSEDILCQSCDDIKRTFCSRYERENPQYNIVSSNCQHFVRSLIPDIPIESDILSELSTICDTVVRAVVFGTDKGINSTLENIANLYVSHRNKGICAWDRSLDLVVPNFHDSE